MAAPTIVAYSYDTSGTGYPHLLKPDGTAEGDVLYCVIQGEPSTVSVTPPAGWTLIGETDSVNTPEGDKMRLRRWWKRAGASEPGFYDWAIGGSVWTWGVMWRLTGCVAEGDPVDVAGVGGSAASSSPVAPGVTTLTADTLLIYSRVDYDGMAASAAPSGMTGVLSGDGPQYVQTAVETRASAGATGTRGAALPSSSTWVAVLDAFRSTAGGGGSGFQAAWARQSNVILGMIP